MTDKGEVFLPTGVDKEGPFKEVLHTLDLEDSYDGKKMQVKIVKVSYVNYGGEKQAPHYRVEGLPKGVDIDQKDSVEDCLKQLTDDGFTWENV